MATVAVTTGVRSRDRQFVQSLERGLDVIKALSSPGAGRTLSEVAREAGLTRASARRFLLTLEELGYVRSDERRFVLTPRVLELGYAFLSSLTLPQIAQPHLRELVEQVHESSSVSVLDGPDVVYVAREPTQRIMTVAISVGTRFPAYATSMGRVLLAGLGDAELDQFLESAELMPLTAATVTDRDRLRRVIDRVRKQRWALVDQELEDGLRSVAVPIHNAAGDVVAAINLSTHASRRTSAGIREELLPPLRETAAHVEHDLAAGRVP
jgi:IclR family transcriptional regulator, pca regulon regulatory protein